MIQSTMLTLRLIVDIVIPAICLITLSIRAIGYRLESQIASTLFFRGHGIIRHYQLTQKCRRPKVNAKEKLVRESNIVYILKDDYLFANDIYLMLYDIFSDQVMCPYMKQDDTHKKRILSHKNKIILMGKILSEPIVYKKLNDNILTVLLSSLHEGLLDLSNQQFTWNRYDEIVKLYTPVLNALLSHPYLEKETLIENLYLIAIRFSRKVNSLSLHDSQLPAYNKNMLEYIISLPAITKEDIVLLASNQNSWIRSLALSSPLASTKAKVAAALMS